MVNLLISRVEKTGTMRLRREAWLWAWPVEVGLKESSREKLKESMDIGEEEEGRKGEGQIDRVVMTPEPTRTRELEKIVQRERTEDRERRGRGSEVGVTEDEGVREEEERTSLRDTLDRKSHNFIPRGDWKIVRVSYLKT